MVPLPTDVPRETVRSNARAAQLVAQKRQMRARGR